MLTSENVRKCVVFIGHKGVDESFCADGTGFAVGLFAHDFAFQYIVTAKHVIDQAAGSDKGRKVLLRVNTIGSGITYLPTDYAGWHLHPEHAEEGNQRRYLDVAAFGLTDYKNWTNLNVEKLDLTYLWESDFCTDQVMEKFSIGIGDEVVVPGLFLSHLGAQRNIPVIRTGNIAAMRAEPVPTSRGFMDAYLIEMRSVGGISGSPVLTHMAVRPEYLTPRADDAKKIEKADTWHYLLGLIHGHYTITTQDEWVFKTDQQVGDINAGIAVVVPAAKILETIMQPSAFGKEAEMAKKYRQMMSEKSRTVEDSAPGSASVSETPAGEENPRHLEDFKRLVDVAARKRPQGDQT
jgi:hypothetical protein